MVNEVLTDADIAQSLTLHSARPSIFFDQKSTNTEIAGLILIKAVVVQNTATAPFQWLWVEFQANIYLITSHCSTNKKY